MPLFDPRTPVELNAAKKLLEGAGTLSDIVGNLYNKYAPAPVKDAVDYWNNTPDPIPGPSPDDPLKMASIVVPWLLMRGGKTAAKAKKIVEKKLGVRDVEELMNIPYTRYQQEAVDIPVSQGGREGVFVTPKIGHTRVDPEMYKGGHGAVEGGDYKVQGIIDIKNPLFIDRDIPRSKYGDDVDDAQEYLGARVMRQLLGKEGADEVKLALTRKDPSQSDLGNYLDFHYPGKSQRGDKRLNSLFTPKERKALYKLRGGTISQEEAVANRLAEKSGYDGIVNLRRFIKEWEPSEAVTAYINKDKDPVKTAKKFGLTAKNKVDKLRSKASFFGEAPDLNNKIDKIETSYLNKRQDIVNFAKSLDPNNLIPGGLTDTSLRYLDKAYRSKDAGTFSEDTIKRLIGRSWDRSTRGSLDRIHQEVWDKFKRPDEMGYNATQLVLLDKDLQKQGAKAVNKLQIDELMNASPEVLKAASEYPKAMSYLDKMKKTDVFMQLPDNYKAQAESIVKKQGSIDPHILNVWLKAQGKKTIENPDEANLQALYPDIMGYFKHNNYEDLDYNELVAKFKLLPDDAKLGMEELLQNAGFIDTKGYFDNYIPKLSPEEYIKKSIKEYEEVVGEEPSEYLINTWLKNYAP